MRTFFKQKSAIEELREMSMSEKKGILGKVGALATAVAGVANEKMGMSGKDHILDMPLDVQREMTKKIKNREELEDETETERSARLVEKFKWKTIPEKAIEIQATKNERDRENAER